MKIFQQQVEFHAPPPQKKRSDSRAANQRIGVFKKSEGQSDQANDFKATVRVSGRRVWKGRLHTTHTSYDQKNILHISSLGAGAEPCSVMVSFRTTNLLYFF
jgi:hypothetical protein